MMWIDGVSPLAVLHAYAAAVPALVVCGVIAALQQHAYQPIVKDGLRALPPDWPRLGIVLFTLLAAIGANVIANLYFPALPEVIPVVGLAAFLAIVIASPIRRPAWALLPGAFKNSAFLLALVLCASMMPVDQLPPPSWQSAFGLGLRLGGLRQHSADGVGAGARRLRLGRARVRRRVRRLDDLVRLVGRRRALEQLPRGEIRRAVARAGLARHAGVHRGVLRHARPARLAPSTTSVRPHRTTPCRSAEPRTPRCRCRFASTHRQRDSPKFWSCRSIVPAQPRFASGLAGLG